MASYGVYTGRWTDYSKGSVLGDQLTLTKEQSNILIAAIALINSFVGSIAWRILSYTFHNARTRRSMEPQGGFFHQVQVLLRNSESAFAFTTRMLSGAWSWRHLYPTGDLLRSLLLILPSISTFTLFTLAGLLLSGMSTTTDVLLRTNGCGKWNQNVKVSPEEMLRLQWAWTSELSEDHYLGSAYARTCYKDRHHSSSVSLNQAPVIDCNYYSTNRLNWTTKYVDYCPFEGKCDTDEIVQLDTGFLDTDEDLGINASPENRLKFRRVMTCSPINTDGHSSGGFVHDPTLGHVATYDFGFNVAQRTGGPWAPRDNTSTFIYGYDSYTSGQQAYELLLASTSIEAQSATEAGYIPSKQIYRGSNYFTLLFLANRALYQGASVKDPWFNAENVIKSTVEGDVYYSTAPGRVLACEESMQVCDPNSQKCAIPQINQTGSFSTHSSFPGLELNDLQTATAQFLSSAAFSSLLGEVVYTLGSSVLEANDYLYAQDSLTSLPLPKDQWKTEIQRLQATSLSTLQRMLLVLIGGSTQESIHKYTIPFTGKEKEQYVCKNFKIKNNAYSSFPVLGLGVVFGIDGLIVLLAIILLLIVPAVQRKRGRNTLPRQTWKADHVLQLHQGLYNILGGGSWRNDRRGYPVTRSGDRFKALTDVEAVSWDTRILLHKSPTRTGSDSSFYSGEKGFDVREGEVHPGVQRDLSPPVPKPFPRRF